MKEVTCLALEIRYAFSIKVGKGHQRQKQTETERQRKGAEGCPSCGWGVQSNEAQGRSRVGPDGGSKGNLS